MNGQPEAPGLHASSLPVDPQFRAAARAHVRARKVCALTAIAVAFAATIAPPRASLERFQPCR